MAETETRSILDLALDEAEEARLDAETEAGKGVPHERVRHTSRGPTKP